MKPLIKIKSWFQKEIDGNDELNIHAVTNFNTRLNESVADFIEHVLMQEIVSKMADEFVKEYSQKVMAEIDIKSVVNAVGLKTAESITRNLLDEETMKRHMMFGKKEVCE